MAQRLDHRHVGVGHVHVLAHDPDANPARQGVDARDERLPFGDVDPVRCVVDPERAAHVGVELPFMEHEWDLVDALGVGE